MNAGNRNVSHNLKDLDDRKLKEIEHSRKRRSILQGFERHIDINRTEGVNNIDSMIRDKDLFNYHFSNMKFYSIIHTSEEYQYNWLRKKCRSGVKVLDFACGNGENGIFAAQCGADVIGIDISPEGVENANLNAKQTGVTDHCSFEVMDGENMTFSDDSFDLGVEYGALHHVELDRAMAELCRVLKPGGEMICVEALRHNPFIHWYRKRTPHLRTQWEVEHILGVESLETMRRYFFEVSVRYFHLAVLAAIPFRKTFLFKPMRTVFDAIDKIVLRRRSLGKYAWIMVIVLGKPIKSI